MGVLGKIFTWWNGATIGTLLWSRRHGTLAGQDSFGNHYYESGRQFHGRPRRGVIYQGSNDASRVDPEWHGWLHNTTDFRPDELPPVRGWEKPALANQTGTAAAYRPAGALERGGNRAAATGDYQAWSPDDL